MRGKRIALLVGAVTLGALVVAVIATWEHVREQWYIRQLSIVGDGCRYRAADALVKMNSARAGKEMLRIMNEAGCLAVLGTRGRGGGAEGTTYLVDPLCYGLYHLALMAPELIQDDRSHAAHEVGRMLEVAKQGRAEVIGIGSPDWEARFFLGPYPLDATVRDNLNRRPK